MSEHVGPWVLFAGMVGLTLTAVILCAIFNKSPDPNCERCGGHGLVFEAPDGYPDDCDCRRRRRKS